MLFWCPIVRFEYLRISTVENNSMKFPSKIDCEMYNEDFDDPRIISVDAQKWSITTTKQPIWGYGKGTQTININKPLITRDGLFFWTP